MTDKRKVISAGDWATIVTLASRGEKTVRDLAEMFKVSPQAIHKGLRQRGVQIGGQSNIVQAEVEDAASAARKKKVADSQKKLEDYSKRFEFIAQLSMKATVDANAAGGVHTANASLIAIKNLTAIIAKCQEKHWSILKVDQMLQENEELAVLNVGEYTEEELEAIRDANEEAYNQTLDDGSIDELGDEEFVLEGEDDEEAEQAD